MRSFDIRVSTAGAILRALSGARPRRLAPALFAVVASVVAPSRAAAPTYLQVPPVSTPLKETSAPGGLLSLKGSGLQRAYNVDLETGRVQIVEYVKFGDDSTALWSASPAINVYAADTRDMLLSRRWLLEFVGKEDAGVSQPFGTFVFDLPFRIPDWMRRVGVDKPKLTINGSYKLVMEGNRKSGTGVPYTTSWFPTITLDQQPAFVVKGTIGRLITVEINSEKGLSDNAQDQMKISYRGEGDELEDDVVQEIEAGNTSLTLTGTNLTGYTEQHRGLFGIKGRFRFGNLEVTGIASQEGGSQERQKLGAGTEAREFPIDDKEADFYRHFWLTLADRAAYGDPANWTGGTAAYTQGGRNRLPVEVFRLISAGESTINADSAQACAYGENGQPSVCVTGRWVALDASEYTYDEELRMLTVPGGHRDMTLSARWQNDPVQQFTGEVVRSRANKVLILSRANQDHPDLDPLMWRNVYSIGRVTAADRDNFRLTVTDNDGRERAPGDTISYVRKLGLEKTAQAGKLDIDNPYVFKLEQGYLILPCLTNGVRTADAATNGDPGNCLTPMKRVRPEISLYDKTLEEVRNGPSVARFIVFGRQRKSSFDVRENSFAAGGTQCYDINPGTERIVLNGSTVLRKDIDYQVAYETGQITLLSARARDPNAELDISYECDPPFQVQDKVLLGTRMEYKLDKLSDQSLLGATVLYRSQTTTERQPELGFEPFSHVLLGANAKLSGSPAWMTRLVNKVPFVNTEARSRADLEFEIARSVYNPNTRGSAYVDNFDYSQNAGSLTLKLTDWTKASPPLYGNDGRVDEALDFRHQGQLLWHSSFTEQYAQIYGNTGNSYTNTREQTLLRLVFQPNDNLAGNSWAGIMRAFPTGLSNHSRKRTLEVVVQGREGTLNVDLGRVSEDISIPGVNSAEPDGLLQSEVDERSGDYNNKDDAGLDGVKNSQGESGTRWECKPLCYAVPVQSDAQDRGLDDWVEPVTGASEQSAKVNGTEGNNAGTGGVAYDTEDLNRNGVLDTLSRYLRFSMPLDSACDARFHCEELSNGWRKYRMPLYGGGAKIDPSNTETEASLLANGQYLRLWIGKLPPRVARTTVQLARVNIEGNTWEEGARNTAYEIDGNRFGSGDLGDSIYIGVSPSVRDSNTLSVGVINRQEERGYFQSPNTPSERDSRTGEPLPERALVLRYENLHPGEVVQATRVLSADKKDFTRYDRISLEVHGDSTWANGSRPDQGKVSFGLRLGRDQGNRDSKDYYEIRLHLDTTATLDPEQAQLWRRNSFSVRLSDLTGLKNDPLYRAFTGREVSRNVAHPGGGDSLTLSVKGSPNLGEIDWMRLVIYADSGATARQSGEIWVNDLRLEGVDKAIGTAIRAQLQLDFADFVSVSGNLQYTNGEFATMSGTKPTPAEAVTRVDYNTTVALYANKFLPDNWGVSLPVTLQYRGALDRPFTRPYSDMRLGGTGFFDIARDLSEGRLSSVHNPDDSLSDIDNRYARVYQTATYEERFSVSYRKDMRSESFLTRALLERPAVEYRQALSSRTEYYRDADTRDYKFRLAYNLSPKKAPLWKPLEKAKDGKYMPEFLSSLEIGPLPEKVNLVLADYSFVRDETVTKARDEFETVQNLPPQYTVDLSHGLDVGWRLFSFLNFGYRIDVNRDYNEDHSCFARGAFFSGACGSPMASNLIFAFDDASYGEGGYSVLDAYGRPVAVDTTHLGDRYGILARERNRTQSFNADFTASPLSWLTTGASFNSGYRHTWNNTQEGTFGSPLKPAHFAASADHQIRLTSGADLTRLMDAVGKAKPLSGVASAVRGALDAWRVRPFDLTYTVSNNYNGEAFTYGFLRDRGVDYGSLLAYQFGFVYGPSNLGTIFEGAPRPGFFDYLSAPDPALGQTNMNHVVNRSVDLQNGFTLPVIRLDVTAGLKYSKQYTLYRSLLPSDTTVVWPEISVAGSLADFASRVPVLKSKLRSLTASTNYNYREESRYSLFSPTPDVDRVTHRFAPLARFTGTTNQDVRIEVSFNASHEAETQHGKGSGVVAGRVPYYTGDTSAYAYARDPAREANKRTLAAGVEPVISWEVETQKGVQFWRYYVRLKNNLRLSLNSSANYIRTEVEQNGTKYREQDKVNASIRPEATYNFTNNVDAKFWALYAFQQEFHTADNEYIHEVALHGEFTMRF
jgi:hypothetical protein